MAKLSHAERSEISRKAWRKRKREGGKAKCAFCGKLIFARGVRMNGKPYHKGCAEAKGAGLKPTQVGKNPKITERKRAPRDAFRYFGAEELNPRGRWIYPLDPDCPKVRRFSDALYGDPMTKAMGAPTDEIMEGFASKHRLTCKRCQMYGAAHVDVAYNPKFKFGPTGFRPPAKWFAKMAQGTSASHFGRKLKELTASQRAKVGQIVGGIWAKYTDATRFEILRKYEPSAVRALANPSMLGKRTQMLNCPACGGPNPVSRLNVYLRCSTCGAPLRSVRVRHKH